MTNPHVLRRLESQFYKVVINDDKVYVLEKEYSVQHVFLTGFNKAEIILRNIRLKGVIDFENIPDIDLNDEILTIASRKQPRIIHKHDEKLVMRNNLVEGESKPLSIRISEDEEYIVSINSNHVCRGTNISVNISANNPILNVLIYPLKIIWIYIPYGWIKLSREKENIEINIRELS